MIILLQKSVFEESASFASVQNIKINFIEHEISTCISKQSDSSLYIEAVPIYSNDSCCQIKDQVEKEG